MSVIVTLSDAELDYYAAFDNSGEVPMGERPSRHQRATPSALERYVSGTYA